MDSFKELLNISYQIIKRLELRKTFDPRESFLIFADPRSGSTWLTEILNQIPQVCIVDEPLNLHYNQDLKSMGFGWRQFIPPDAEWNDVRINFSNLLSGKKVPPSCYKDNGMVQFLKANQAVFKIIRGKLLLEWLLNQFTFNYKPIFLIRHPMAMINSISRHSTWQYSFQKFKLGNAFYTQKYDPHLEFLESLESNEEQILAHWCIANLSFFENDDFLEKSIVVKYEELLLYPEACLKRIMAEWNVLNKDFEFTHIDKPSSTSLTKVTSINPESQISKWQIEMDQNKIDRYQMILDYFRIDYDAN